MTSLRMPFVSGVVDSSRAEIRVLYTFLATFPTFYYQPDSNMVNLEATFDVG